MPFGPSSLVTLEGGSQQRLIRKTRTTGLSVPVRSVQRLEALTQQAEHSPELTPRRATGGALVTRC